LLKTDVVGRSSLHSKAGQASETSAKYQGST
jgi:hypothetical protein